MAFGTHYDPNLPIPSSEDKGDSWAKEENACIHLRVCDAYNEKKCTDDCEYRESRLPRPNADAVADFLDVLEKAISVIHTWHGEEAWEIYFQHAPEMKPIATMWKKLKEAPPNIAAKGKPEGGE